MRLPRPRRMLSFLVATILTALSHVSCAEAGPRLDADIPSYIGQDSLAGELVIAVAEEMKLLVQAWADDLMRLYPELQIVVTSERTYTSLSVLLARQTEMVAMSRRMTPAEVGNCLLEFGDKPIAVPVAHYTQAVSVGNDDQAGYKTRPVKPVRVNAMASDGPVAPVPRSEMHALRTFPRSVYLYGARPQRAEATHASAELIRYALSRQGQQLALDLGYVPLSVEEVRRVRSRWSASRW